MKLSHYLASLALATSVHAGLSEWQAAVSADNPRNWYRFDETAGTTLTDHGPGALNGTYVGITINQPGLFGPGQAAMFPGQPAGNDLVQFDVNTWASQTIAGDWTAEFIIYKAAAGQGFSQALYNGPATSVRLEQWNSFNDFGDYRGGVTQYGVADYYLEGTVAPPDEWSHMVFVRSGGQTFIYLNGVHRGSMANVVNLELQTISRSSTTQFDKLNATLDEAIVYDRALTSGQVAAHFATTGIVPPVVAPTISGQPQPQSIIIGTPNATATFTVVAAGTLPLHYEWRRNGEIIAGVDSETLTLTDVTAADAGTYSVVVSNSGGSLPSADATLSIVAPPFNEGNQTVLSGFPATLSVTLADLAGYQFVWKKDGAVVDGETSRTLSFASAAPADSGAYTLEITFGTDTVIAGPARLIVPAVPTTDYATRVLANNPIAYWRLNDPDQSPTIADERNALNNSQFFIDVDYQLPGALLGDANAAVGFRGTATSKGEVFIDDELSTPQFSVELWARRTGGDGTFTSPLTFRDFSDTAVPPYRKGWLFYATDANRWQFRIGDGTATWVSIDGPPVVNGEWTQLAGTYNGTEVAFYVNGALVESRVAAYAPIDPAQLPPLLRIGGGSTEVEVGGFFFTGTVDEVAVYGSALTAAQIADHWAAAYSPTILPVIDGQPQSTEVAVGGSVTLAVVARSGTPVSYQWKKDGSVLDGETSATLILAGADAGSAGNYTVDVTNSTGTTTSQAASVAVVGPEASYEATVLRDAPVAYWRLGETAGPTATDAMGNYPGTYGAGIALGEAGAIQGDNNTAARFTQATASFVEVPASAALNAPQFTFECWAKVTGGASYRSPITSRADGPQRGYIFYATPANVWEFWTGPGWNSLGSAPVQNDTWVYLAGTHDGTTKRFFVNGQQVASNQSAFSPNDASVLRIGGGATESPTGDFFFEGLIDEVAVYNRALSPARILTHYLAGQPPVEEIVAEIALEGDEIVISWAGTATLQETEDIAGSWDDVAGASSPFRVTPAGNLKFWRLRNP